MNRQLFVSSHTFNGYHTDKAMIENPGLRREGIKSSTGRGRGRHTYLLVDDELLGLLDQPVKATDEFVQMQPDTVIPAGSALDGLDGDVEAAGPIE